MEVYFDNSATTKLDREVVRAILPYLTNCYGNPSSPYILGRENRKAIETARKNVAKTINANENEIIFTSGGSESNNLAIKGIAFANHNRGRHIITSKIEHPSVLEACKELEAKGFRVSYVKVNENGVIDFDELLSSIQDDTILISIMHANNEIGIIEPIHRIGAVAKAHNIYFHTDCVQTVGNLSIDVKAMGIDLLSMSAHKLYGPKGVGALYVRDGVKIKKLISGGHQENNRRAGTENLLGIVGFGKAIELSNNLLDSHFKKMTNLRTYFLTNLFKNCADIKVACLEETALPNIISITVSGAEADNILTELDKVGIFASTGSACTTGSIESSHVLRAIGLSETEAHSTIRLSFGRFNTFSEIDIFIGEFKRIVESLRRHSIIYNNR